MPSRWRGRAVWPGRPSVAATGIPNVLLAGDWVGPEGMLSDASAASALASAGAALRLLASVPAR